MNEEHRRTLKKSPRLLWQKGRHCARLFPALLALSSPVGLGADEAPTPDTVPAAPASEGAPADAPAFQAGSQPEVTAPPTEATEIPPANPADAVPEMPSQLFPPGINQLPPAVSPANPPAPAAEEEPAAVPPPDPTTLKYPVTQFHFQYAPNPKIVPKLPPIDEITKVKVDLGFSKDGITAADRSPKKLTIDPNVKAPRVYFGDAILAINKAVVAQLNKHGIFGVYVLPDSTQVEAATGDDKRTDKKNLTLLIYVSEVKEIRTVTRKVPFHTTDKPVINDPADARIREKSPIFPSSAAKPTAGLLQEGVLQDYLARINRFPGRRVDAAVNASDEPGKITLDYLVRKEKPWSVYLQTSNTGTASTGEWRSRIGAEIKELANKDDILRLEYSTSDLTGYQAASLSYEFAPIFPDYLKVRTYFSWGRYSSQDIGISDATFDGQTFTTGGSLTWTPVYIHAYPLDITGGVEWQNISSTDEQSISGTGGGSTNFLLVYGGVGTERSTDKFTLATNVEFQGNLAGLIGTDQGASLAELGRPDVNREFYIGKYNFVYSVYLEPLLYGKSWDSQKTWWKSTRAHEFAFSVHGQTTFGDARLVPQLQSVVGGFNTVRGYPESFVVGDSSYVGSFEYRFHLPRAFRPTDQTPKKPVPANVAKKGATPVTTADQASAAPPKTKFLFFPDHIGGSPDWDLIFRAFVDAGQTYNNRLESTVERDRTLVGAGVGLELQVFKPIFISFRADWGVALISQTEEVDRPVRAGDSRFNLSATLAF